MLLDLVYYDDPLLRQKAQAVEEIDESVEQFARDMIETMDHYRGIGLAAPQVGRSIRLFVARLSEKEPYEEWLKEPVEVLINPQLYDPGKGRLVELEGCLSLPGMRAKVERPDAISIRAQGLDGRAIERVYTGYLARVLMHENDHLNGVLYIDRLSPREKASLAPQLRRLSQKRRPTTGQ